jgi:hypothetical protein
MMVEAAWPAVHAGAGAKPDAGAWVAALASKVSAAREKMAAKLQVGAGLAGGVALRFFFSRLILLL